MRCAVRWVRDLCSSYKWNTSLPASSWEFRQHRGCARISDMVPLDHPLDGRGGLLISR